MRAYFFGNMYLSSIQNGIQSAHCVSEMFKKYETNCGIEVPLLAHNREFTTKDVLYTWAKRHKTMILLNGGYASNLDEIAKFFARKHNPYPWAKFKEEEASLNKATTCVGIVLPAKIYDAAKDYRTSITEKEKHDILLPFGNWERVLITDVLCQYQLAH